MRTARGLLSGCVCGLTLLASNPVLAQPASTVQGLIYYVVENVDAARAEQRGTAGSFGVAFDRLILGSNTRYRIWLLEAATLRVAEAQVQTENPGQRFNLPDFNFRQASSHDTDRDRLPDLGEFIVGTDPHKPDTDGDGIHDGAEVRQGTDPLSGRAVRTGIIATAETPGTAYDISALNDVAAIADRGTGIAVFNVFNGMNPILIAQVDTPGDARAVVLEGNLVAVADGSAGLAVIDISDPPEARIIQQVQLNGEVAAVTAAGSVAYAGLSNGDLVAVDMPSGTILGRIRLEGAVQDVTISGDTLYALIVGKVFALPLREGGLQLSGSADSPGALGAGRRRLRLFAGDRFLYATFTSGYNIFDISGGSLRFIRTVNTAQFGWKQIVANGAGLGLAAVSPNSTDDGPHHISRYDLGDGTLNQFQTTIETPGLAAALSIYNGLAYVADSAAGLQVINYLAYDNRGIPPTISLETSFSSGSAEEGKLLRVTARVSDDVQVRNVEFYVDGARMGTDGNFPFEHRFVTPLIVPGKDSFRLQARASDTGGNATWSEELLIRLVPDATPPRVLRTVPFNGALSGGIRSVAAFLSEPLASQTVNSGSVTFLSAGADGVFGTADDASVGGTLEYREALNAIFLLFPDRLAPGNYRFSLSPTLADLAGNQMASRFVAEFRVFSFIDEDQDGMPDELEAGLGLNPADSDTDNDGILDGLEDPDNDQLPNGGEVLAETNPSNRDSDADGILDGAEDPDADALSNLREFIARSLPLVADTDRDGWNDETEVTSGSDPSDPGSRPRLFFAGRPRISTMIVSQTDPGVVASGMFVGRPPVQAHIISLTAAGAVPPGSYIARPPVVVLQQSFVGSADPNRGIVIGRPPVQVRIQP